MSEDFALVESTPAAPAAVCWVRVALDVPLPGPFDYRHHEPVEAGLRVIVPFGRRKLIGVVVDNPAEPSYEPRQIKPIEEVLRDLPPFDEAWLRLARFAAEYYQRPLGEVMLPTLPPPLRRPTAYQGKRSAGGPVARLDGRKRKAVRNPAEADQPPELNDAQREAVDTIAGLAKFKPVLLYGVTGSGKTEVYLRAAEKVLAAGRQVLLLVPEINLTPQLEGALRARLEGLVGTDGLAVLHSGLSDGERLQAWARAQRGQARMLLGTRMAIFAPMGELGLIVVDEEHDASYKQQDGLRYSARDLAVWRAHDLDIPVVLGSATPSLETWQHAERGRYLRLALPARARASSLPAMKLVDTRRLPMKHGMSPQLLEALAERLARKEQSLIFLNRRGFAPVLHCQSCGWVSNCPRCTAFTVLHRTAGRGHRLQCHHCGYQAPVPHACPECGDQDLAPMGRGTQRVEEQLQNLLPGVGVLRMDADTVSAVNTHEKLFRRFREERIPILLGTQMVAKGLDFENVTLSAVLDADLSLYASDYRAAETTFSLIAQVAGRAGRGKLGGRAILQTMTPQNQTIRFAAEQNYDAFFEAELPLRQLRGCPPYRDLLTVTFHGREEERVWQAALAFRARLDGLLHSEFYRGETAAVLGPAPASVARINYHYRCRLTLSCVNTRRLRELLAFLVREFAKDRSFRGVGAFVDVNGRE